MHSPGEARKMIESLVPEVTRNACVENVEETASQYNVTIAGTSLVTARCELPRDEVEAAVENEEARTTLGKKLKQTADHTVVPLAEARG